MKKDDDLDGYCCKDCRDFYRDGLLPGEVK
jgi:hypothetical protein